MWSLIYLVFYIIFSVNTLVSVVFFILILFLLCFLLFQIHVEYLTYLILLLYLGGILIFFLFTALMLNKASRSINEIQNYFSFYNILFFVFGLKCFFLLSYLNFNLCYFKSGQAETFAASLITNNYNINDLFKNQGDILNLLTLYTEKSLLLGLLGLNLLFTMMGVIIITRNK